MLLIVYKFLRAESQFSIKSQKNSAGERLTKLQHINTEKKENKMSQVKRASQNRVGHNYNIFVSICSKYITTFPRLSHVSIIYAYQLYLLEYNNFHISVMLIVFNFCPLSFDNQPIFWKTSLTNIREILWLYFIVL